MCAKGHSTPSNQLVICEGCARGYHQLCALPCVDDTVVASDLPWHCPPCDLRLARMRAPANVLQGTWTDGQGAYSGAMKREWLEGLPLTTLVGYVLSVEQKVAGRLRLGGLDIWPNELGLVLEQERRARRALAGHEQQNGAAAAAVAMAEMSRNGMSAAGPDGSDLKPVLDQPLSRSAFRDPILDSRLPFQHPPAPPLQPQPLHPQQQQQAQILQNQLYQPQPQDGRAALPPFLRDGMGAGGYPGGGPLMSHPGHQHPTNALAGGGPLPSPNMTYPPQAFAHLPQFTRQPGAYPPLAPPPVGGSGAVSSPFPPAFHAQSPLLSNSPRMSQGNSPQLGSSHGQRSPHLGHGRGPGSGGGSAGQSPQMHAGAFPGPPPPAQGDRPGSGHAPHQPQQSTQGYNPLPLHRSQHGPLPPPPPMHPGPPPVQHYPPGGGGWGAPPQGYPLPPLAGQMHPSQYPPQHRYPPQNAGPQPGHASATAPPPPPPPSGMQSPDVNGEFEQRRHSLLHQSQGRERWSFDGSQGGSVPGA